MNSRLTISATKRTTIPSPFLLSLIIDKITIYSCFIYLWESPNVFRYIGVQIMAYLTWESFIGKRMHVMLQNRTLQTVEIDNKIVSYLGNFLCHIVCSIFNLGCDNGFIRRRRGGILFFSFDIWKIQSELWNLVDGTVFVEIWIRCGSQEAWLDMIKRP